MLAELQRLNETWTRAWLENDAATVERLMADDYLYVGPKGPVLDRPSILRIIRSPSYRLTRSTRTEVVVRPLGNDAAIIRHRAQAVPGFILTFRILLQTITHSSIFLETAGPSFVWRCSSPVRLQAVSRMAST